MTGMDPNALGNRLRAARRSVPGRTAADVASLITSSRTGKAVSQPSYSDWENGKEQPGEEWLDSIAAFLGISRREVVLLRYDAPGAIEPDRLSRLELQVAELLAEVRSLRLPPEEPEPPKSQGT